MIHTSIVYVIVASVRANRIGHQIAAWVAEIGRAEVALSLELVDLKDWRLPMDEPGVPAFGKYPSEETRAWSEKIARADAFVFVTPQYNWGYPAALKNALDHLYREWRGKPAMIVTYGGHGGSKCAAQLRQVLEDGLKMKPLSTMPAFSLSRARIEADTGEIAAAEELAGHEPALHEAFAELVYALGHRNSMELP